MFDNNKDYGSPYPVLQVKTKYGEKGREKQKSIVPVIAGVIAAFVLIIIVIVVVIMWKRRKTDRNTTKREYDNQTFHLENEDSPPQDTGHVENYNLRKSTEVVKPYHTNSQVSQDDVPAENDKDLNKVKEESDGDAVRDFTYEPDTEESLYANSAVAVSSFEGYVARKMARTKELSDEYKLFPLPDLSRCKMALTPDNKQKNRYRNIYAYDDTRVILDGEEKNSYINATYITGYNKKKEYIATQGTKDTTFVDFWRLLWQEKANRIVMVTNVKEKGKQKIDPYWPHDVGDSLTLDDFKIKTEAVDRSVDYITRTMSVSRGGEYRTVHQFHFTTWEDKKRPIHGSHTILAFLNKVHSLDKLSQGPLIIHCSAGVGRTGTFIALDILQQMAIKQKSVDLFNCVQRLRNERMLMVQTLDQYIFLHEAMVEFIKSGHTSMDYQEFQATFANILQSDPGTQVMTRIKKELQSLNELKKSTINPRRDGLKPENVNKNRNKDVIPDDFQRLFLSRGKGGNYINAVFSDSFQAHNTYVVTQMPLPQTILDFWQLILENEIQAIVMLNEMDPEDKTCLPYWPESVNTKEIYGRVEVELMSVKEQDFIVIRELKVTELAMKKLSKPEVVMIRQFQLLSWPQANDLPPDRGHLLTLLGRLQIWQQKKQEADVKRKILVHCIDGGSRSGMFCGASFMLDKMKAEQVLDAFLAVRYVTRNRPQFFTKLHEYKFLYQMAMEYLKGHADYYNVH
ncbi:hypothetical protein LSH36_190g00109 [Paralvinella palmiformis]|uniref:protein-tyrosine-phosphatase n=1 Tax=Paralvinella palmiformis TaxID=53620 RepID=A0AAD9JRA3_9ANNE|nr:hypothetical protein LSH36_190g00109 [Paralvinella palmiformis]